MLDRILSLEGVGFTHGNFANSYTTPGFDEEFFDKIPFDLVYHDAPLSPERMREVHYRRMAEVVYEGELPTEPFLHQIVCRTACDRESLLWRLGPVAPKVKDMVRVEQIHGSVFMHWGLYIQNINFHKGDLLIDIKYPRTKPISGRFHLVVRQYKGEIIIDERDEYVDASSDVFCISGFPSEQNSHWEIFFEDVIAFCGRLPVAEFALV